MGFELLGLGFAVSKTIEMGLGFIFSSDTLGFVIIGTGILRKIRLGNEIKTPRSWSSQECVILCKICRTCLESLSLRRSCNCKGD